MCTMACLVYGARSFRPEEISGKRILEVGAYDVNGSLRPVLEAWRPAEYVGVDIAKGPGVDVVCRAEELIQRFGPQSFDVVLATEVMEHVRDWRTVISNLKGVCKPGGILMVTTVSYGFPYHAYPYDFWRYQPEDMRAIFSDCEIESLETGINGQAVFVKARKPGTFRENDLSKVHLYSIVVNRRVATIDESAFRNSYYQKQVLKQRLKKWIYTGEQWFWEGFRAVFKV